MSDDASSQLSPDRAGLVRLFEDNLDGLRRMDELASEPGQVAIRREDVLNCLAAALVHDDFTACEHWIARLYSDDVPFMIIVNELANFRDNLIKLAANANDMATVHDAVVFFDAFKDRLASLYLVHFLRNLEGRNHVRLRHISSLSEKNLLIHFGSHLQWMKQLVDAVSTRNHATMPETHHELCEFGAWLHQHGRTLIRDESHYQLIDRIHAAMHDVVKDIEEVLEKDSDRHLPLLALMKKTERHSLELGNEISMLNNMVIMSVYNKDALTGALTRRNLERILINELELSRATETPFCLLMGDLDHFKAINDNYGHVVGDRAIAHFAGVVRASRARWTCFSAMAARSSSWCCPPPTMNRARSWRSGCGPTSTASPCRWTTSRSPSMPASASWKCMAPAWPSSTASGSGTSSGNATSGCIPPNNADATKWPDWRASFFHYPSKSATS
ncbi:MAG TPA: diguanylate cyclase [Thiobacillaceae bacterium]|nr:diguanylate cyclase [Thiobacillaceae bacterium]